MKNLEGEINILNGKIYHDMVEFGKAHWADPEADEWSKIIEEKRDLWRKQKQLLAKASYYESRMKNRSSKKKNY